MLHGGSILMQLPDVKIYSIDWRLSGYETATTTTTVVHYGNDELREDSKSICAITSMLWTEEDDRRTGIQAIHVRWLV